ncbi:MAG: cytidyltransferase-related domain protein [Polaromonas sp.]|nr:cytidyltransferase-related domain protein [Polaromonas sp.]
MTSTAKPYDVSVYIGRFQIFHNGQLALLRRALQAAPLCIVVLGSAHQARTPKNPFTWQERAEMVRLALPEADRGRVQFLPVRDYYDQARWVSAVRQGVLQQRGAGVDPSFVLVGHFKDASSDYLQHFAGWALDAMELQGRIDASSLRDAYFGNARTSLEAALAALVSQVPASTVEFLRAWAALPYYQDMAHEWANLKQEKAQWAGSPYPPVFVTVDAVVHCAGQVLLIERGRAPGKGLFAVPGGFIESRETVYQSTLRELAEETGIGLQEDDLHGALKAVQVFDHPDRSQRGRVITHAHLFDLGARALPQVQAADDAAAARWFPVDKLAGIEDRFHDDHFHMLDFFFSLTSRA